MRINYERDTKIKYEVEEYARKYDDNFRRIKTRTLRTKLVAWHEKRIVKKYLGRIRSPLRLVDVPCGTGKLSDIYPEEGAGVVAGDISAAMMNLAKSHYLKLKGLTGLVRFDASHCPFKDGCFDGVVTLRLLHRVPEKVRGLMLKEFARISKEYVVISFGFNNFYQRLRAGLRGFFLHQPVYRELAVSRSELNKEIAEAGLRLIESSSVLHGLSCEIIVLAAKEKKPLGNLIPEGDDMRGGKHGG